MWIAVITKLSIDVIPRQWCQSEINLIKGWVSIYNYFNMKLSKVAARLLLANVLLSDSLIVVGVGG